jgi:subtilisin family serine protease
MVHFAAAGNSGTTFIGYPATLSTVNAIAALDPTGQIASFSDRGIGLAFSAPGTSVYTTDRSGAPGYSASDYAFVQGTSFASSYASGVAALMLSKNAVQSAANVETIMQNSCVDRGAPGYDTTYGWGFVNAAAALAMTPAAGPPGAFALLVPAAGAINVSRLPTFSWEGATNAPVYAFTLDDNSDFSSPLVTVMTALDSYVYTGPPLPVATEFYWKVVASNGLGSTMSTPGVASFTSLPQAIVAQPSSDTRRISPR